MSEQVGNDKRTVKMEDIIYSFTDGLKDKQRPKGVGDEAKEKHGCNIIIPADHPKFAEYMKANVAALEEAGAQQWGKPDAHKAIAEDNPKRVCLRKGERFKNEDGVVYDGYEGNYAISATGPKGGENRPKMYDRYKRPLKEQAKAEQIEKKHYFEEKDILEVFYSGTRGDVIISYYGTDKGGRGIFCSIDGARSKQEGDRLAGGGITVTDDMFADIDEPNPFDDKPASDGASGGGDSFGIG